jgi:predicted DNA-binding ArsR family transcriptional regulator
MQNINILGILKDMDKESAIADGCKIMSKEELIEYMNKLLDNIEAMNSEEFQVTAELSQHREPDEIAKDEFSLNIKYRVV